MLGKTGFNVSVFEIPEVLVETDLNGSTGLFDIFFIAGGTRYLIDRTIVVLAFCTVMSCCEIFTDGVVCTECIFHISILESFPNGSSLFPDVSKFCRLYFFFVFSLFLFTM